MRNATNNNKRWIQYSCIGGEEMFMTTLSIIAVWWLIIDTMAFIIEGIKDRKRYHKNKYIMIVKDAASIFLLSLLLFFFALIFWLILSPTQTVWTIICHM